jgi:hypothetical protein
MPSDAPHPPATPPTTPPGAAAEDARLDAGVQQLRALLLPGERLEAYAVQRRLFALVQPRLIVAATSGRFLVLDRQLLGGYTLADVRWQDLRDATMRAGIFGADLTITALEDSDLATADTVGRSTTYRGLRKDQAQEIYRLCQAQEQAWREKRRVRDLDELRARSGGIQLGATAAPHAAAAASTAGDDPTARLRRAKEMLDAGLLTDAEFESIKARIIDGL